MTSDKAPSRCRRAACYICLQRLQLCVYDCIRQYTYLTSGHIIQGCFTSAPTDAPPAAAAAASAAASAAATAAAASRFGRAEKRSPHREELVGVEVAARSSATWLGLVLVLRLRFGVVTNLDQC